MAWGACPAPWVGRTATGRTDGRSVAIAHVERMETQQVRDRFCKPICKPDAPGQCETGETRRARKDLRPRVGRGQSGNWRLPETAETRVVWLITQRSRVQIPPPLPGKTASGALLRRPFSATCDQTLGHTGVPSLGAFSRGSTGPPRGAYRLTTGRLRRAAHCSKIVPETASCARFCFSSRTRSSASPGPSISRQCQDSDLATSRQGPSEDLVRCCESGRLPVMPAAATKMPMGRPRLVSLSLNSESSG
jgi:hypothetical protein